MPKWNIDPDHSVGAFSVKHLMVAHVHGQINRLSGTVHFEPTDITSVTVECEMDVSNIITGITKRDDHLKSQDFFDAEKFPKITFRSTKTERTGFHSIRVGGEMTIHGTTKPVTFDSYVLGPVKSPFGETCIGLNAKTVVNREDFGLLWNVPLEKNGVMVGRYVEISVNIEADLVT